MSARICKQGIRDEEYPETLDGMMGKVLLFRIYVKSGHLKGTDNVYSVAAICDDEELVEMNLPVDFVLDGFDTGL
ncbi:hypothetical protein PIB30_084777, partial [Stylosanthes scabra]|nr:hypothetical protein [Stylosanthes scabra]